MCVCVSTCEQACMLSMYKSDSDLNHHKLKRYAKIRKGVQYVSGVTSGVTSGMHLVLPQMLLVSFLLFFLSGLMLLHIMNKRIYITPTRCDYYHAKIEISFNTSSQAERLLCNVTLAPTQNVNK